MTVRSILTYPDPRLNKTAAVVDDFGGDLERLIADMLETMYDAHGIGLAATQINVHKRVIVMDLSAERNQPLVFINPNIVWRSEEKAKNEEGCLSVPGIYDLVERAQEVKVAFQDQSGKIHQLHAVDLQAVCIQHEMDHLSGIIYVDYLSSLKQERIKTKLLKKIKGQSVVGSEPERKQRQLA